MACFVAKSFSLLLVSINGLVLGVRKTRMIVLVTLKLLDHLRLMLDLILVTAQSLIIQI